MKYLQNIVANAIIGAILGSIFLLPYLGWLFSGHGIVVLNWSTSFLVVGIIWGLVCGIAIGFVPLMMNSSSKRRIIMGMIIGGLSGTIFYLIGDLAFLTEDGPLTILFKSFGGLIFGIISGGISALVLGSVYSSLNWISIRDDSDVKNDRGKKNLFKNKFLSAFIGLNAGFFIGNFLLVLVGQILIVIFGAIYHRELFLAYLLQIIFGCFTAIYLYIKPLKKQLLQRIINGLRNGIAFALLSILYHSILTFIVLLSPFPKPEFISDDLFVGFVLVVVGVFTLGFGFSCGITGATFEAFFVEANAKLKTAS